MEDNGGTKDDVKIPDGEVGDKINRLFREEEKDTSKLMPVSSLSRTNRRPDVYVLTAMGEEAAIDAKEAPRQ